MKRSALVFGLSLVLATVGTLAVVYYVRQADARALAGKNAVTVLVADQLVPAGTSAGDAQRSGVLRAEPMPVDSVPADALGAVGPDVAPLVAAADIQPGQLVLRTLFVDKAPASSPLPIPAGRVAVTVQLGLPQDVAGYVTPGAEVAVFDTGTDGARPLLLIPRIAVLAVGPAEVDGQPAPDAAAGVLLTFAASAEEAELLVHRAASLHLALLREA
ncbi:RcpC/CpaB family pilus assembly protein [Actinophytocola sp.]|uniref:RcpC/CpaB family pilus assembly protein n=1 Tax=Actinophytocola sp. TaxID=1872138 RepID=UPI002ED01E93